MNSLINRFRQSVRDHRLIQRGDAILCAVSGGPDSVMLLKLLLVHRRNWNLRIGVFHMNHRLRAEAGRDLRFVEQFCRDEGVEFYAYTANVPQLAKKFKLSIEEAARNARYDALHAIAKQKRYSLIATAHTLDDQCETVLMRLLRGSGLKGLTSIVPKRSWKDKTLIRPLLEIPKSDILSALKHQKIKYRTDETNQSNQFFRNRIRKELLPFIERRYSPAFRSHLAALSAEAGEIYIWVNELAAKVLRQSAKKKGKSLSIPIHVLKKLPPPVRQQVIFQSIESLKGNRRQMTRAHIRAIDGLLDLHHEARIILPHALMAKRYRDALILSIGD